MPAETTTQLKDKILAAFEEAADEKDGSKQGAALIVLATKLADAINAFIANRDVTVTSTTSGYVNGG